ncbi:hypothetical protein [Kribbella jiaozuonensis]|uniref:hypothetical protein n=2 Tax=Kribbellaceae TaxID=2726069 RepID=UPI001F2772C4|nr:hypothetical protein [Kribbella jiaozuonensis]
MRTFVASGTMDAVTTPNPRRPILPGNKLFESLPGAADPATVTEAAHRTAELLVRGVRKSEDAEVHARVVKLADEYGLDELAELWSDSPADSLPGALWRLYVLRSWVHSNAEEVSREFATGRKYAEVHAVVAGVAEPPGPAEVRDMVDAVLRGVATGDFATTLDRAAAFARIIATGRAHLADDGHDQVLSASKLVETADQLQTAARAERAGHLW